jgi:hypothetical protein
VVTWTTAAVAVPIVDQSNVDFLPGGIINFSENSNTAPLGQEFTPQFDRVDFVQLLICCEQYQESIFVRIREGSMAGPVLGTSAFFDFDDMLATFRFGPPIELIPGDVYVIEIVNTNFVGQSMVVFGDPISQPNSVYEGGRMILAGQANPGADLWFQEGMGIPEPSTGFMLALGLAALRPATRRLRVSGPARVDE